MRALLDTHAFLWFVSGSERMSATARQCIADPDNDLVNPACPVECLPSGIPLSGPSKRDSTWRVYSTGVNPV
jgi:hypothetical protein